MDKLESMNAFAKVVAAGSYAEAARRLGLTRSAVSKAVMELERLLGARLLDRTTRRVTPTEAGLAYYERCVSILADVEETEIQVSRLGLPPMHAPDFAVTAMCQKPAGWTRTGAGDWICTLVWRDPDRRTVHDTYDLAVTTDGCYTATIEGESLGGPTLKALGGGVVRNLLYTFEGCFDTSAP